MIRILVYLLLLLLLPRVGTAEVIVHPKGAVSSVQRQYLVSIFTMRTRTWPDGTPIRVFTFPHNHSAHHFFVKKELKMFPYQLRNVWDRLVFSGGGQSPHVVNTLEEMYEQVSNTPGAIGYTTQDVEGGRDVELLEVK